MDPHGHSVTGGAGFIGSHLVEALLAEGRPVRVVDNLATGHRANLAHLEGRYEWIEGDLAAFDVARRAVEGAEYVFHQAAIPSVPRSVAEPIESHEAGPTATLNMLEAARRRASAGSCSPRRAAPTATPTSCPSTRGCCPQPLSPYAAGKLAGEHYVRVYARTMGLDGVSLRYFNVFGPRQDPSSPYSGVISRSSRGCRAASGRRSSATATQTRDFTYVANVVAANLAAMRPEPPCGGEAYNVGTGRRVEPARPGGRAERDLRHGTGARVPAAAHGRRGGLAGEPGADRRVLGYRPIVGFEEGLRRTVEAGR